MWFGGYEKQFQFEHSLEIRENLVQRSTKKSHEKVSQISWIPG
jgi:hypothetical protein